jgi:Zn-dependent protease with chaperone function
VDFFAAQTRARTKTRRLVVLFAFAVFLISAGAYGVVMLALAASGSFEAPTAESFWNPTLAFASLGIVICIVGAGSLYKWATLREGGEAVARMMGGQRVCYQTAGEAGRRLLNIVEEMSIASGMPIPAVFVLPDQPAINAFAAGLTTSDAIVAVSQGALEHLDRAELQAVIGHEFSHILNGDMRMNLRLTAIIFGILVFALLGRQVLESAVRSNAGRGKKNGASLFLLFAGFSILVIGYAGYFFGRLIQAAVSRQREFLADASSVQFTRNPDAMANALNRIRTHDVGAFISGQNAGEISHTFFAQCFSGLGEHFFATHPPLEKRIKAIVPDFELDTPVLRGPAPEKSPNAPKSPLLPPVRHTVATFMASIGDLDTAQVERARSLLDHLPPALHDAARDPARASSIILGLLLDPEPAVRTRQNAALVGLVIEPALLNKLNTLDPFQRLPLLQIALGVLHTFSRAQQDILLATAQRLVDADGRISIFECALMRLLRHHLDGLRNPRRAARVRHTEIVTQADSIAVVLSFITHAGHSTKLRPAEIFSVGASTIPSLRRSLKLLDAPECNFRRLDSALEELAEASPDIKQQVLLAAAHTAAADAFIHQEEAELLRIVACALDCPIPPSGSKE